MYSRDGTETDTAVDEEAEDLAVDTQTISNNLMTKEVKTVGK